MENDNPKKRELSVEKCHLNEPEFVSVKSRLKHWNAIKTTAVGPLHQTSKEPENDHPNSNQKSLDVAQSIPQEGVQHPIQVEVQSRTDAQQQTQTGQGMSVLKNHNVLGRKDDRGSKNESQSPRHCSPRSVSCVSARESENGRKALVKERAMVFGGSVAYCKPRKDNFGSGSGSGIRRGESAKAIGDLDTVGIRHMEDKPGRKSKENHLLIQNFVVKSCIDPGDDHEENQGPCEEKKNVDDSDMSNVQNSSQVPNNQSSSQVPNHPTMLQQSTARSSRVKDIRSRYESLSEKKKSLTTMSSRKTTRPMPCVHDADPKAHVDSDGISCHNAQMPNCGGDNHVVLKNEVGAILPLNRMRINHSKSKGFGGNGMVDSSMGAKHVTLGWGDETKLLSETNGNGSVVQPMKCQRMTLPLHPPSNDIDKPVIANADPAVRVQTSLHPAVSKASRFIGTRRNATFVVSQDEELAKCGQSLVDKPPPPQQQQQVSKKEMDTISSGGFHNLRSKFEAMSKSHGNKNSCKTHGFTRWQNSIPDLSNSEVKYSSSKSSLPLEKVNAVQDVGNKVACNVPLNKDAKSSDDVVCLAVKDVVRVGSASASASANKSAFENIRKQFEGGRILPKSSQSHPRDKTLVQFVDRQNIPTQSSSVTPEDSTKSHSMHHDHDCKVHQKPPSTYETHRKSAFTAYNGSTVNPSLPGARDDDTNLNHDVARLSPPNDIPWKHIEPNDIPWADRELLEERDRSFSARKVDLSFSYGAEYLDYSYEDEECDGVTLCPTASDVSSLSVPSCLRSVETSSATSFASRTSDEDTGAMESMSEKQSTTLGPSEASSSQTSEAAAPLIHSTLGAMSMRFASSSDTTGTFSYDGAHFNALLGALPPPIDVEENDDNSDDLIFHQVNNNSYDYEYNKQFEDELRIQSEPKWKNDFFAVDSVKSCPTADSADVSDWVPFPSESNNMLHSFCKNAKRDQIPKVKNRNITVYSEKTANIPTLKLSSQKTLPYRKQEANRIIPVTSISTISSFRSSLSQKVESTQSDTEKRGPKVYGIGLPVDSKSGTGAYRRFDVQRVRAFQQARRNKSFATS